MLCAEPTIPGREDNMKKSFPAFILLGLLTLSPPSSLAGIDREKNHDYLPQVHNVIFLFDVSDSMIAGYPENYDMQRLFIATRALSLFNYNMPHVPRWQYDVNTALITYGDCKVPNLLVPLSPFAAEKYKPLYGRLRNYGSGPYKTAGLPQALQLAGSMALSAAGRTAIVIFSDGGNSGECPQCTAEALKKELGDKVVVYAVFFGDREIGWRNLYEVCKLTGGYTRHWEEVRSKPQMRDFVRDITVREIMFPYPEIFFQEKSAELIPSEALKLESVANFLNAIPQYHLQIDGHTTFFGSTKDNYKLGMERAKNVKETLVKMYRVHPDRIQVRSWGEELPRYDNQNPDVAQRNRETDLYLTLPLRNYSYDEKNMHTFGVNAVGDLHNTQERVGDEEWAWPANPVPSPSVIMPSVNKPSVSPMNNR
jgi:outer membrane protein OmpA-like peptidoglycan-associated protein